MAGAYPGFRSMKQLRVLLLPPGRDVSPSQGYPPAVCRRYPFIHLARVVQQADNSIHRINHYPADSALRFLIIYPVDSDLSGG